MGGKYAARRKKRGGRKVIIVLLIISAILALGITGIWLFGKQESSASPVEPTQVNTPTIPTPTQAPVNRVQLQAAPITAAPTEMPTEPPMEPTEPPREQKYQVP